MKKRKINKKGKLLIIFIIISLIVSLNAIIGTNKGRTGETRTNTQAETKVSENVVKMEIKDKPKVCGLSTIQCDNYTEEIETISKNVNETDLVKKISAKYGVDWKLIESIVRWETGNRTSLAYKNLNNAGGLMGNDGLMKFETVEESYEFMIKAIKTYYIDKGLTTIEQIGSKYCPVGAKNDEKGINQFWVSGVKAIYESLS